jgi:5-methylcytosine-specific restriction enzyme B
MHVVGGKMFMTQADQIRQYVIHHYIQPARTAGKKLVTIQAGTIHAELQLENRMPNVCSSLDAQKFYEQASVTLVKRSGPKQSSTAEWLLALV